MESGHEDNEPKNDDINAVMKEFEDLKLRLKICTKMKHWMGADISVEMKFFKNCHQTWSGYRKYMRKFAIFKKFEYR